MGSPLTVRPVTKHASRLTTKPCLSEIALVPGSLLQSGHMVLSVGASHSDVLDLTQMSMWLPWPKPECYGAIGLSVTGCSA